MKNCSWGLQKCKWLSNSSELLCFRVKRKFDYYKVKIVIWEENQIGSSKKLKNYLLRWTSWGKIWKIKITWRNLSIGLKKKMSNLTKSLYIWSRKSDSWTKSNIVQPLWTKKYLTCSSHSRKSSIKIMSFSKIWMSMSKF